MVYVFLLLPIAIMYPTGGVILLFTIGLAYISRGYINAVMTSRGIFEDADYVVFLEVILDWIGIEWQ